MNPEKGSKLKAVMAGESDSALCIKALAGPMDRTARLVCGAKPQKPMPDAPWLKDLATMKLAAGKRHNGRWVRDVERRPHPQAGAKLRRA
jgi:hypothetical protein